MVGKFGTARTAVSVDPPCTTARYIQQTRNIASLAGSLRVPSSMAAGCVESRDGGNGGYWREVEGNAGQTLKKGTEPANQAS